jgi:hypothetical protein
MQEIGQEGREKNEGCVDGGASLAQRTRQRSAVYRATLRLSKGNDLFFLI